MEAHQGDTPRCSPMPRGGLPGPRIARTSFPTAAGCTCSLKPDGGRYRRINDRCGCKYKTLALGVYPEVALAKARARRKEAREQFAHGVPSADRQASGKTFEDVARDCPRSRYSHPSGSFAAAHRRFIIDASRLSGVNCSCSSFVVSL